MSFKIGDKVRLTGAEWSGFGKKGWTGKIVEISSFDGQVALFRKGGDAWYVYDKNDSEMEADDWGADLVETTATVTDYQQAILDDWSSKPVPKFKVGDVVRMKNVGSQAYADGKVFTINKVAADEPIEPGYDPKHPDWYQIYYAGHDDIGIWEENLILNTVDLSDHEKLVKIAQLLKKMGINA